MSLEKKTRLIKPFRGHGVSQGFNIRTPQLFIRLTQPDGFRVDWSASGQTNVVHTFFVRSGDAGFRFWGLAWSMLVNNEFSEHGIHSIIPRSVSNPEEWGTKEGSGFRPARLCVDYEFFGEVRKALDKAAREGLPFVLATSREVDWMLPGVSFGTTPSGSVNRKLNTTRSGFKSVDEGLFCAQEVRASMLNSPNKTEHELYLSDQSKRNLATARRMIDVAERYMASCNDGSLERGSRFATPCYMMEAIPPVDHRGYPGILLRRGDGAPKSKQ